MLPTIAAALLLVAGLQSSPPDRARAEELARSGHNAEAIELFRDIVARNPADTEARLWMARLALRMGDTAGAESQFRAVVADHPDDIDARIGLGMALTRNGDWRGALELLRSVELSAGENSDLFGAPATIAARSSTSAGRARSRRTIPTSYQVSSRRRGSTATGSGSTASV